MTPTKIDIESLQLLHKIQKFGQMNEKLTHIFLLLSLRGKSVDKTTCKSLFF